MGKYFWMKHGDNDGKHNKQPGCMFGLVNVLGYHLWHSSARKKIQHHKHEGGRDDRRNQFATGDRSPKRLLFHHDDEETETLLDENKSRYINSRRSPETKKRSRKARIRSLISEEIAEDSGNVQGKGGSFQPNLQRTNSIHHLESLDVDWKHHIIFLPGNVANHAHRSLDATKTKETRERTTCGRKDAAEHDSQEDPDVLEMFAVDRGTLIKHLDDGDEGIFNFSRSALGLTPKAKLSKSRSFPMAELSQRRKLKPVKLESKQNEVWSYPRKSKFRARSDCSDYSGTISGVLGDVKSDSALGGDTMIKPDTQMNNKVVISDNNGEIDHGKLLTSRNGENPDNNDMSKYTHRRSSSLNESLNKYARLFENSFRDDAKLNSSRSLTVANEYGHAPVRRMLSLSNVDFYYLTSKFEVLGDDPNGNVSVLTTKATDSGLQNNEDENTITMHASNGNNALNANTTDIWLQVKEDDACLSLPTSDVDHEKVDGFKEEACTSNYLLEETDNSDVVQMELPDQGFVLDSDICLHETESRVELQISEDMEPESSIDEVNFSDDSNELKSLPHEFFSTNVIVNLDNDEISDKACEGRPKPNGSDLCYVRLLLDHSGIARDASGMSLASNNPFSPELFEELEACWPHEQHQLTGWPDFHGCWHHRMLFDLVNNVMLEVYDMSLPYYPKALSSSCQVKPFLVGNRIIEEVYTSIDTLMKFKPEEMESLDSIVAIDMAHDRSWMNLQTETECVALEVEDMIFDELLEEVMVS